MKAESRDFGLANGHSPMADKVVCIDFDGTIYPFGELFSRAAPLPGAAHVIRNLASEGWHIVIFTSRLSEKWLTHEGEDWESQLQYIVTMLDRDGIPFHDVVGEKVPAEYYVDDKAVEFRGVWADVYRQVHKHFWVRLGKPKGEDGYKVCGSCALLASSNGDKIDWEYRGEQDPPD
jgi:hypothetical protein